MNDRIVAEEAEGVAVGGNYVNLKVKQSHQAVDYSRSIVEQAKAVREAAAIISEVVQQPWSKFIGQGDDTLRQLRMTRMAIESETKACLKSLQEVSDWLNQPHRQREIKTLRALTRVAKELAEIKKSGWLERITSA